MARDRSHKAQDRRPGAEPHACRAIVGIGASAGGIETLGRLFDAMPTDSGCAFVVILHLDPTHESQLAPLLGRHTTMPVVNIADGMVLAPDRVHVIVPDRTVTIADGKLHLTEPAEPRGQRHPVDDLFVSMAAEEQRAVGIVLSGTGANGTHGLREIKAAGGMTLVQEPSTARFAGMPRNAIAAGVADQVLAPEKMPEALLRYLQHGYVADPEGRNGAASEPGAPAELDPVLTLLRVRSNQDFRGYKRATLQRRIHRRMGLADVATLADYVVLLHTQPDEVDTLVKDLMISVTGFFRDAEAWTALDETVIGPLVAARRDDAELRFWVPACATGEEAYSLAMLAVEHAEAAKKPLQIKIFATDRLEDNLRRARDGVYAEATAASIRPTRLRRFFDKLDGHYRVKRSLRELVVFAPQNLLRDPPFSRLDLITCRNLLIYLEPEAQQRVTALFHFALREGGCLFIGNAESLGRHDELFETLSKKWRIYCRLGPTRHDLVEFPVLGAGPKAPSAPEQADAGAQAATKAADLVRRVLLERYAPASVLIDRKGRTLYVHGPTSDYLALPSGEPTRDLLAMVRHGLRANLRGAMRQAMVRNESVTFAGRVGQTGADRPVSVTVAPVSGEAAALLLVSFESVPEAAGAAGLRQVDRPADDGVQGMHAIEEELKSTRADLQGTIEQLEGANEELKASNEEVTSMNEELQSSNEELETSKEELQSFNEELHTINSQLQQKVQELDDLNNDQHNLLAGTETATLFLDAHCRIKWFAPACRELLNIVSSDIGRPLGHFALKFDDPNLLRDVETVLTKLTRIEAEVQSHAGRWYLRRLIPYRTQDNRIAGVVATLTDITERKLAAAAVDEERIYSAAIVETVRQPLLVLGGDFTVATANRAFYDLFRTSLRETEGRRLFDLGNRQWNIPALRRLLEELLPKKQEITDFEVSHDFESIGRRIMRISARALARGGGRPALILLAIEDITERRQAEEVLRLSEEQFRTLFEAIDEGFCVIEMIFDDREKPVDYRFLRVSPSFEKQTGLKGAQGKRMRELAPHHEEHWFQIYGKIALTGEPARFQNRAEALQRWYDVYAFRTGAPESRHVAVLFNDITERKKVEAHRDLLMGEAHHRVKNTLATVQAIAAQSLRQSPTLEAFRTAFEGRLGALARGHDLLTGENWQGSSIAQLVRQTLEPYAEGDGGRIMTIGPRLLLPPHPAVALLLILHELATNAAKYGALSTGEGKLAVTWRTEDGGSGRQIRLQWAENGGPPVSPPSRRSFGTMLIERSAAGDLGGAATLDFAKDGLCCELTFPLPLSPASPVTGR